jgi:hypothetical protein
MAHAIFNRLGLRMNIADASNMGVSPFGCNWNCLYGENPDLWDWDKFFETEVAPWQEHFDGLRHICLFNPGGLEGGGKMWFTTFGLPHCDQFEGALARHRMNYPETELMLYLGSTILDGRMTDGLLSQRYQAIANVLRRCEVSGITHLALDHVGGKCVGGDYQMQALLAQDIDAYLEYTDVYVEPRPRDHQWVGQNTCSIWPDFERTNPDKYEDAARNGNLSNDELGGLTLLLHPKGFHGDDERFAMNKDLICSAWHYEMSAIIYADLRYLAKYRHVTTEDLVKWISKEPRGDAAELSEELKVIEAKAAELRVRLGH